MMKSTARVRRLRAEFKPATLTRLDQRSREARLMREFRAELVRHVGGKPSTVETGLIERAAQLQLRLAIFDARFAEQGDMTEHDSRTYLAWSNSLARTLAVLGLKPSKPKALTANESLTILREEYGVGS
jgi:hypothetical protein